MISLIDYLLERRTLLRYLFYLLVFAILVWSMTVDTSHAHTWLERTVPGFWSLFGLGACIVLIFAARWFAGAGIGREEDYYDN
jgi:hypothetical protein